MKPILRPAGPDDQEFLFQLYFSTREAEFASLGWQRGQLDALLRMQFLSQQRWYETAFPAAEHRIVMLDDAPVGRIMVHRGADAATLVDIALLPQHRGQGIGNTLIQELIDQCTRERRSLRLQVLKTNPAARLYARLGFVRTGEDGMYLQMERPAGQPPPGARP